MYNESRKRKNDVEMDVVGPKQKNKSFHHKSDTHIVGSSFVKCLEEAAQDSHTAHSIPTPDSGIIEDEVDFPDDVDFKPAWLDEDDEGIVVGAALNAQGRKLPRGGINSPSNQYSSLLKHKFESTVGTPKWALLKREKESDLDSDDEILQTSGFIRKTAKQNLPCSTLELKKVLDLNSTTYSEGMINCIEFHPQATVALVAGNSGIASLYSVDGKMNSKLHSVEIECFPILCAAITSDGDEALLGSRRPYLYSYDLMTSKAVRVSLPHGLTQAKKFELSPDSRFIAVAGKWGEVHLLQRSTKSRIGILKQDSDVTSLCFNPSGSLLYGHSSTGEVTVWDMNMRRVRHRWVDEGCLHGSSLVISSSNQFIAAGSTQGVVNLYGVEDAMQSKIPKPRKTVFNLTTGIGGIRFNSTSEMLAFYSSDVESAVRLLHIGSGTVFSNFPVYGSKLGHITAINFSPSSGYIALGNKRSGVALYRLKHYKSY